MQTTLIINDDVYRSCTLEAARLGVTIDRFVEDAIRARLGRCGGFDVAWPAELAERDRVMESLLAATAHFRVGERPTREDSYRR
jgi:hypothetical protein